MAAEQTQPSSGPATKPTTPAAPLHDSDTGRRVVHGGIARAAGYAAILALGTAASVFLMRHLGVVDFGRYALAMSLIGIVAGVTDAGLTATGVRLLVTCATLTERRALIANLIGLRLVITPLGVAACAAFAVLAGYPGEIVVGTLIAGAGLVLITMQASMALALSVDLRYVRLTVGDVVKQAIGTTGTALLAIAGAGLVWFFGVQIAIGGAVLALTPVLVGRNALVAPRFHAPTWRRVASETLPLAGAYVIAIVYARVLLVVVSLLASGRETGYFASSFRVFEFLAAVPVLLAGVGLPVLSASADHDPVRFRYVLRRMSEVGLLCGLLLAIVTAAAAEPAIVLLGGEQYRPAAGVLRITGFALVGIFLSQTAFAALVSLRAQKAVALSSIAGLVVVLTLGLSLVPAFGAEGAALAVAIGDAFLAAVALLFLRRHGAPSVLPLGFAARAALACAVGLTPLLVPGLPGLIAATLAAALFVGAALVLRLVPGEVLETVGLSRGDGASRLSEWRRRRRSRRAA